MYHIHFGQRSVFANLYDKKVLLDQLKQLEVDGLILREEKSGFPPEVSYRLSEKSNALMPVLSALENWANVHVNDKVELFEKESGTKRWRRNHD